MEKIITYFDSLGLEIEWKNEKKKPEKFMLNSVSLPWQPATFLLWYFAFQFRCFRTAYTNSWELIKCFSWIPLFWFRFHRYKTAQQTPKYLNSTSRKILVCCVFNNSYLNFNSGVRKLPWFFWYILICIAFNHYTWSSDILVFLKTTSTNVKTQGYKSIFYGIDFVVFLFIML